MYGLLTGIHVRETICCCLALLMWVVYLCIVMNSATTIKQKYLHQLKEFETSEMFITSDPADLQKEIENNCVYIIYPDSVCALPDVNEFAHFLTNVKVNRKRQLLETNMDVDLIYYSWVDDQAGQFRFNIINSNHKNLPFHCPIVFVSDEMEIVKKFYSAFREVSVPWKELHEVNGQEPEKSTAEFTLEVYKQIISR
jgi:hypothetical protein